MHSTTTGMQNPDIFPGTCSSRAASARHVASTSDVSLVSGNLLPICCLQRAQTTISKTRLPATPRDLVESQRGSHFSMLCASATRRKDRRPVHHGVVERCYDRLRFCVQRYVVDKQEDYIAVVCY